MTRRHNRVASSENDRWFERYGQGGYFCLPRALLFNIAGRIDNATFYVYVALASCHFEGNTTYAGPHIAKLTGKDERAVRGHLTDLETLGLIRREPFGRGYRVLFECPDRDRIKEGVEKIDARKLARAERRRGVAQPTP
jgi:DNA-binding transcriptional ArsR family regulator